jgi:hypothetical protein
VSHRIDREGRAQSEVLGFAVLAALAIGLAAIVVVVGGSALTDARTDAGLEQARAAIQTYDARADAVAFGDTTTETVSLAADGSGRFGIESEAGRINISRGGTELYNRTLGAVTYETRSETLAYQSGGVWRRQGGTAVTLDPPPITYRNETGTGGTLTVRVVRTTGGGGAAGGGTFVLTGGPTDPVHPNVSSGDTNPIRTDEITITVTGPYADGWKTHFERAVGADAVTSPAPGRTTLRLDAAADEIRYLHVSTARVTARVD